MWMWKIKTSLAFQVISTFSIISKFKEQHKGAQVHSKAKTLQSKNPGLSWQRS